MGDTELTPFDMGTFGSRSTPQMGIQLRRAGASARELLIGLAAERWQTDRARLVAENERVLDTGMSQCKSRFGKTRRYFLPQHDIVVRHRPLGGDMHHQIPLTALRRQPIQPHTRDVAAVPTDPPPRATRSQAVRSGHSGIATCRASPGMQADACSPLNSVPARSTRST